jgi:hypothetical protein
MKSRTPHSYSMGFGSPHSTSPSYEFGLSFYIFFIKKGVNVETYFVLKILFFKQRIKIEKTSLFNIQFKNKNK